MVRLLREANGERPGEVTDMQRAVLDLCALHRATAKLRGADRVLADLRAADAVPGRVSAYDVPPRAMNTATVAITFA